MISALTDMAPRGMIAVLACSFMLMEYLLGRLEHHDSHDAADTAASFGVAIGHGLIRGMEAGFVAVPFALLYQYRLFDIDARKPLGFAALFIGTEFLYYWQHRAAHHIRWLWATHAVHHSARRMNLTSSIRIGWTGSISGNFLFFLPLALIGFHPLAIAGILAANLLYQFFIHTELVPTLGPLEWILNTPAHHRVHHASNESCLDKNFGGMLIVFDRLFGTFAAARPDEILRYGLRGRETSHNPLVIAFTEWLSLIEDALAAPTIAGKLKVLFGPVRAAPPSPVPPKSSASVPMQSPGE